MIGSLNMVLLVLLVLMALWAVMATRLLYAAFGLAGASIALALIMFRMASPLAAVIELSVCAGLITAIFISVISLVKPAAKPEIDRRSRVRWKKYIWLPVLALALGLGLFLAVKPHGSPLPSISPEADVRDVFWNLRQADLFGQILLLLIGAFGIVILFKERLKK
jgi:NADH-quinone oxidoreductase subunit J